jgi:hypothetical protein
MKNHLSILIFMSGGILDSVTVITGTEESRYQQMKTFVTDYLTSRNFSKKKIDTIDDDDFEQSVKDIVEGTEYDFFFEIQDTEPKTFCFLMGQSICNTYHTEEFEEVIKEAEENGDFDIYQWTEGDHPSNLVGKCDGWMGFAEITQEEYEQLEKAIENRDAPSNSEPLVEGTKYARQCDETLEGMNEGYCFNDGTAYFKYEKDAEKYAKKIGYESLQEAYDEEEYYYTQWEVPADAQYIVKNGKLVEIED